MKQVDLAKLNATAHAQASTCSFDVFDTFLVRRCTTPDGVFERAFQLSPVSGTHAEAAASYAQHRIDAEGRARKIKFDRLSISEVTIEEIYARFPFRLFGLDGSALPVLVQAEFAAEIDLCRTNIEILRLYRQMRASGRRTGFISDTYWGSERLALLLRSCQPDIAWDFLYASCDYVTISMSKPLHPPRRCTSATMTKPTSRALASTLSCPTSILRRRPLSPIS
jgi:predicted HAD superfamily hydrolase